MLRRFSILALAIACGASLYAQQQSVIHMTVKGTPANDGKQMFVNYCAPCHGVDGRGAGPVASTLKVRPANLTVIARNNHGEYPAVHLMAVLKFGVNTPAHGTQDMPVWGPVFGQLSNNSASEQEIVSLRVRNLVKYMETLQAK